MKDAARRQCLYRQGPSGTWEQDDMDNWADVTQAGRGTVARRVLAKYQMGRGHYQENEQLRGKLGYTQSDINQRAFYQRWADLMAAESWRDLRAAGAVLGEGARDGRRG